MKCLFWGPAHFWGVNWLLVSGRVVILCLRISMKQCDMDEAQGSSVGAMTPRFMAATHICSIFLWSLKTCLMFVAFNGVHISKTLPTDPWSMGPNPQPTVYGSEFLSFGGERGCLGYAKQGYVGFPLEHNIFTKSRHLTWKMHRNEKSESWKMCSMCIGDWYQRLP